MTDYSEKRYTRRDIVKRGGSALTFGVLASAFSATLPRHACAADTTAGVSCLTVFYPAGAGITFNADYYRDRHITMMTKLYGVALQRVELRKVLAPQAIGTERPKPPIYVAAANIWINDLAAFTANHQKYGKTVADDVPNFTNSRPVIQYDKVYGEMGAKRSVPKVGDTCLTLVYPNSEGVRWDADYYRTSHMPLIMRLYGPKSIKRFELRKGETDLAGAAPAFAGTVNIYIENQAEFDDASKLRSETLRQDVPNFSSVMPSAFPTVIHAVG